MTDPKRQIATPHDPELNGATPDEVEVNTVDASTWSESMDRVLRDNAELLDRLGK